MGKVMRYTGETPDDLRELWLFPHPQTGNGSFTLVEDDGISTGYQQSELTRLRLTLNSTPEQIRLSVDVLEDGYPLPYEAFVCVLPAGDDRPLSVNGVSVTMQADARGQARGTVPVEQIL
jgi:hypothetical protein